MMIPLTRQSFVAQAATGLAALDLDTDYACSADAGHARKRRRSIIKRAGLSF